MAWHLPRSGRSGGSGRSMMMTVVLATVPCVLPAGIGGQTPPRMPSPLPDAGAAVYAEACAPCHGVAGDGRGPAARRLGEPSPRDFTLGTFKLRSTPTGWPPTEEDLLRTVSDGVPDTWMPAFKGLLSEWERVAVVAYIKAFAPQPDDEGSPPVVVVPAHPPSTPEQLEEGRFVYLVLGCGKCHGRDGRGNGPSASELEDDSGATIRPIDLTRAEFKRGDSPEALYATLVTGLDGTPMPALEPSALRFPGDLRAATAASGLDIDSTLAAGLDRYLRSQPSSVQLEDFAPGAADSLAQSRIWALVTYLRSLQRDPSFFEKLFRVDPERAPRRSGQ